jgi:hypothetical protein
MGHDRYLVAGISCRLIEPLVGVSRFDTLDLEMIRRQRRNHNIRALRAAAELLPSSSIVAKGTQELSQLTFACSSFLSAIDCHFL